MLAASTALGTPPLLPQSLIGQISYATFDALSLFAAWKGDRIQRIAGGR